MKLVVLFHFGRVGSTALQKACTDARVNWIGEFLTIAKQQNKSYESIPEFIDDLGRLAREEKQHQVTIVEIKPINLLFHFTYDRILSHYNWKKVSNNTDIKMEAFATLMKSINADHIFYLGRRSQFRRLLSVERALHTKTWHIYTNNHDIRKFRMPLKICDRDTLQLNRVPITQILDHCHQLQDKLAEDNSFIDKAFFYEEDLDGRAKLCCQELLISSGITNPKCKIPEIEITRPSNDMSIELENWDQVVANIDSDYLK